MDESLINPINLVSSIASIRFVLTQHFAVSDTREKIGDSRARLHMKGFVVKELC